MASSSSAVRERVKEREGKREREERRVP